jgi:hypothetical protein
MSGQARSRVGAVTGRLRQVAAGMQARAGRRDAGSLRFYAGRFCQDEMPAINGFAF